MVDQVAAEMMKNGVAEAGLDQSPGLRSAADHRKARYRFRRRGAGQSFGDRGPASASLGRLRRDRHRISSSAHSAPSEACQRRTYVPGWSNVACHGPLSVRRRRRSLQSGDHCEFAPARVSSQVFGLIGGLNVTLPGAAIHVAGNPQPGRAAHGDLASAESGACPSPPH